MSIASTVESTNQIPEKVMESIGQYGTALFLGLDGYKKFEKIAVPALDATYAHVFVDPPKPSLDLKAMWADLHIGIIGSTSRSIVPALIIVIPFGKKFQHRFFHQAFSGFAVPE
jgi:hypothetical protein